MLKKNYETIIKFIMVGMLRAYDKKIISFDDLHFSLFAPKGEAIMEEKNFHESARFISIGMELEDIYNFHGEEYHNLELSKLEDEILESISIINECDDQDKHDRNEIFFILKEFLQLIEGDDN